MGFAKFALKCDGIWTSIQPIEDVQTDGMCGMLFAGVGVKERQVECFLELW